MRITVCEMSGHHNQLAHDWDRLVAHTVEARPDFVLLPEMPFFEWLPARRQVSEARWLESVDAHAAWLKRLPELGAAAVAATRPVYLEGLRYNEGFVWTNAGGYQATHRKAYLPDEPGFWEATWYARGPVAFRPYDVSGLRVGFQICTEVWFMQHARDFGKAGVQLICSPRATPAGTLDRWLAAGRVAALISGAFHASSNHGPDPATRDLGVEMAGGGWIASPTTGELLAVTDHDHPAVSVDVDLAEVAAARTTYPRYVDDSPVPD